MKIPRWSLLLAFLILWTGTVLVRVARELKSVERAQGTVVGSNWDPRDKALLDRLIRQRESDSFKERLSKGISTPLEWPGLRAAQSSWTWLEMTSGIHYESSYEGDFSWMFSKLYTLLNYAHPSEYLFLTSLAPFYFVIGQDHAGATLMMHELQKRIPDNFNVWFWSGFHSLENLKMPKMAADFYERAAQQPFSPAYVAALALRLRLGEDGILSPKLRREALERSSDPRVLEKIKQVRPEWFR